MAHRPRHEGGFSQGQSVIGSSGSTNVSSSPSVGPPSVGFNVGQVDPGLMSGVMQVGGMSAQEANQIAQQAMGNTGQGFGITGTGNFGTQDTSGSGTDTSGNGQGTDPTEGEKPEKSKFTIPSAMGIIVGLISNPTVDFLKSINGLSILSNQVLTTDAERKRYYEEYKDKINEAGYGSLFAFKTALEESPEGGVQGEESQYRLDPASYFEKDFYKEALIEDPDNPGKMISEYDLAMRTYPKFLSSLGLSPISSRFAQTTGGISKLAQSNIEQYKKFLPDGSANPNYNPDFLRKVFDARAELDRQGVNWMTGNKQGRVDQSGSTITGIAGGGSGLKKPFMPLQPMPILPQPNQPSFFMPTNQVQPMPYDYFSQSPQYTRRGIADPNLAQYYQNLNLFPRVV